MALPEHLRDEVALVTERQLRCGIFKTLAPAWALYLMIRKRMQRGRWPCNRTGNVIEYLGTQDFWDTVKWMRDEGRARITHPQTIVELVPAAKRDGLHRRGAA